MCGRFTLTVDPAQLMELFPWAIIPTSYTPRYNIAPTQPVAVIPNLNNYQLDYFRWGLIPSWAKDIDIGIRMINARAETLSEKPSFKTSLKNRRCLILSDGFYEWKSSPGLKIKTPYYIHLLTNKAFAFAGLWDTWKAPDGSLVQSCSIITTTPNSLIAPIHNRMPAILRQEYCLQWVSNVELDQGTLDYLFSPYPSDSMEAYPVSRAVNDPNVDNISLIKSV